MAHWKARVEFLLRVVGLLFLSLTAEALQGKMYQNSLPSGGVGHLEPIFQGKRSSPCQYIDTTRKAIDCAITLPLTFFIQWNFAAHFSSFIVEIVQKTTNLGTLSTFWGSYGRRRTSVDDSLESPCGGLVNCNRTSFLSVEVEALQGEMCQNSLPSEGGRSLGAKISGGRVVPVEYFFGFYKTRHILLSDSANCTVLRAVVLTRYRRVTDDQTDGQTELR